MSNVTPLFVVPSPQEIILLLLIIGLLIAGKHLYNRLQGGRKIAQYESFKTQFLSDEEKTSAEK